jgi:hypothetical protein
MQMTINTDSTTPEERLQAMGLALPEPPAAVGAYLPWQIVGSTVTTSFQFPWLDGVLIHTGLVGKDLTTLQGIEAARICALNGLAQLRQAAGGALRNVRIVRIDGHVGCSNDFMDIPAVLDGASKLINALMQEQGRHARTALGHGVMPLNVPVMLGFFAEII